MSLDKTQPWQGITFRNSADEYPFTHVVFVKTIREGGVESFEVDKALCGQELPEPMLKDIDAFGMYINTKWVSCLKCQHLVEKVKR